VNRLLDALENCIVELQSGEDLEVVLQRRPDLAEDLRPFLSAALEARRLAGGGPTASEVSLPRAEVLRVAARLAADRTTSPRSMIPNLRRVGAALSVTFVLLSSGTGLVHASSAALPGEDLYPVKRTWEKVQLVLVSDDPRRLALSGEFENERLEEINELLARGRQESIRFAGVYMDVNGDVYVSGIPVVITSATTVSTSGIHTGAAVLATGHTSVDGHIELESLALMPVGAVVPVGRPVITDTANSVPAPSVADLSTQTGTGTLLPADVVRARFHVEGIVNSIDQDVWVINGRFVYVAGASIDGSIQVGTRVEVEGFFDVNAQFVALTIESEHDDQGFDEAEDSDEEGSEGDDDSGGDGSEEEPETEDDIEDPPQVDD